MTHLSHFRQLALSLKIRWGTFNSRTGHIFKFQEWLNIVIPDFFISDQNRLVRYLTAIVFFRSESKNLPVHI